MTEPDGHMSGKTRKITAGLSPMRRMISGAAEFAHAFRRARSGAGAVEFAILAPILLMLYIGAFEITVGMSIAKRASRSAGTIADLVTQQKTMTKTSLSALTGVVESIFVPYSPTNLKLKISAIDISSTSVATIKWSWQQDGSRPYAVGAAATVPADLKTPSSFLIHAELKVDHTLGMFLSSSMSSTSKTITISRDFYFRQRIGDTVACSDC